MKLNKYVMIITISLTVLFADWSLVKASSSPLEKTQDFNCQILSEDQDIGSVLDPTDTAQFTCLMTSYDGSIRQTTTRDIRFLIDPSITSMEEARASIKTEVPLITSDFDKERMIYTNNDKHYKVSYWEETGKYYYSRYSIRDICSCNDPTTSGLKTAFKVKLSDPGMNTFYVLLPDYNDITRSFVCSVSLRVRDLSGPVIDTVSANWVDESKGAYNSSSFIGTGSKEEDNSLKLSVNSHDNVTGNLDEDELTYRWYHDGLELDDSNKSELILSPDVNNNGIYTCMVTDGNGNTTTSDSIDIYNFDTMAPSAEIKRYRPIELADGTINYEACDKDDKELCSYQIISIDYDDTHLADDPVAITKDTEDIPDASSNLWTHMNRFMITENGKYRIYVRDMAGNMYSSDVIDITGIVPSAPLINAVLIEPKTDKKGNPVTFNTQNKTDSGAAPDTKGSLQTRSIPYMTVTVDASSNGSAEGLKYKLTIQNENGTEINVSAKDTSDGFQASPVFDNLTDDANYILYVKNALDVVSSAKFALNKDFYFSAGKDSSYLARMLLKPLSWSHTGISLGVSFGNAKYVDELQSVSFDGGESWISIKDNEAKLSIPSNGTYEVLIKDKDGHIHRSGEQVINNIDTSSPKLDVTIGDDNKSFDLKCSDDLSGLSRLCYTYKSADGKLTDMMPINVFPANDSTKTYDLSFHMIGAGIYTFYLYDMAGNVCKAANTNTDGISITVGNVAVENPMLKGSENEVALKILENISYDDSELTKGPVSVLFSTLDTNEFANNAYSWDEGVTFSDNRIFEASKNGTYHLTIKDIYGNTYKSGDIVIENIDSLPPSIALEQEDNKLMINTYDLESGIENISWKRSGSEEIESLKDYEGTSSVKSMVSLPCNGAYTIYVTDGAGNTASAGKTIANIINVDNISEEAVFEDIETSDTVKSEEKGTVIDVITEIEEPEIPLAGEIVIKPVNYDNPTGSVLGADKTSTGKAYSIPAVLVLCILISLMLVVSLMLQKKKRIRKAVIESEPKMPPLNVIFEEDSGSSPEAAAEGSLSDDNLDWF